MINTFESSWSHRLVALVASVGLMVGAVAVVGPATPAFADCDGGSGHSTVFGDCDGGGGGSVPGYDNPLPGTHWVIVQRFPDRVCTNRHGEQSYMAAMYATRNGVRVTDLTTTCFVTDGGAAVPSVAEVKLVIPKPTLDPDFKGKFLTGAPVKFTMDEPGILRRNIPGFNARVEARPKSYLWEFGDGTKSTDESPTHVYASKDVNDQHMAKVQLTVTYDALLFVQDADGPLAPQDLGEVTVQSTLERQIVEVWSALTTEAR